MRSWLANITTEHSQATVSGWLQISEVWCLHCWTQYASERVHRILTSRVSKGKNSFFHSDAHSLAEDVLSLKQKAKHQIMTRQFSINAGYRDIWSGLAGSSWCQVSISNAGLLTKRWLVVECSLNPGDALCLLFTSLTCLCCCTRHWCVMQQQPNKWVSGSGWLVCV